MPGRPVVYLVDGTSQLFRAFFAIRGLTSADGTPTGAAFGFTTMLRKLVQDERPAYLGVAFDLPGPTFRHDAFADYKANRPPVPEELDVQVPFAKEICRGFRIPILELPGFEADDLIATYTRLAREHGFDVVIVASDKDLLQLVEDGVTVLNPSKNARLDAAGVEAFFGVPPDRVRDVLGLMGDAVDNIPGVPGVGEKTAVAMASTYGPVEAIVERAKRFVAAFERRDALVEALGGERPYDDEARAFVNAARALIEVEKDDAFRARLEEAVEAVAGAGAAGNGAKERRALGKRLQGLDKGSQRRIWTAVVEHEAQARMSRDLATVDRQVPADFDARALAVEDPDRDALAALFRRLGFRSLTAEFSEPPPPVVAAADETTAARYRTILTVEGLRAEVEACRAAGRFALDTETTSADPLRADLVGISLCAAERDAAYVPIGHAYLGVPDQLRVATVRELLGPLLADPSVAKVGQNLKYDDHVLRRHGMPVAGWALDTMVAAFLLDPDRPSFGMDGLARDLLGVTTIPYAALVGTGAKQITIDGVSVERATEYAAEDADVTLRLANLLEPRLGAEGLAEVYATLDHPLLPVLAAMEARGIRIDAAVLERMSREMDAALERTRAEIHALAGGAFNVDSPKQLRTILFDKLALAPRRRTAKTGEFSTDASTLEDLAEEHEIARKLLEYRELAKLKGTYVDALPKLVHPATGRVHTSFHPTGAATGRLSSSDPNLQNIPARTAVGLAIRAAFVPEEGWVFLASDYSQVELRVLAHLSGDPALTAAFRAGEDVHRVTAAQVFGVPSAEVDDAMRRRAKAVNFGILYGMSETRLARDQGMTRGEARAFIQAYFDRFRAVRTFIDGVRADATRDGAVRTLFGRRRIFRALGPGAPRAGRADLEQALRAAVNTVIQGTAADLMKRAMLDVDRALRDGGFRSRMLLQVHDELLLECPADELEAVRALVRDRMERVHPLDVPLVVDSKTGADWRQVT